MRNEWMICAMDDLVATFLYSASAALFEMLKERLRQLPGGA
jgi:hypothetical protein